MKTGYLFLGGDTAVPEREIIGIFDLDRCTVSGDTREFLKEAERENRVKTITAELPKSFVLCGSKAGSGVYLSQLAPATLYERYRKA